MKKNLPNTASSFSTAFMRSSITSALQWRRLSCVVLFSSVGLLPMTALVSNAQEPTDNTANINFVGADIESVIKAIGHYTGVTFLIDPRVKGQISLVSEKPLTKDQAFQLLTSSLRLQGFTVVTGDGYTKVVPEADAKLQPGPTQVSKLKGDQVATQIFRLNYEAAANIVTVLRPLISPNNTINSNPGNNTVVITDYADNLTRMGKIIAALDVPANNDLDVVPIKYAIASDIATIVTKLTENTAGPAGDGGGRTVLLADSRTNSVLVKAPSLARANLVKSLIDKLDQPTVLPGNVHVVYLKNADAVKLAQTLRSILSPDSALPTTTSGLSASNTGGQGTSNPAANGGLGGSSTTLGSATSSINPTASATASPTSGGGFIQADPATNTLIITASEGVYRNMRGIIDQLDARRAQVYVEALIVELKANQENEFGIQWLAATGDASSNYRVGGGTSFQTSSGNNIVTLGTGIASGTLSAAPGAGATIGLFRQINGKLGLGALAHALESTGNGKVLSIPTLITLDNEEAQIIVGQNVPFITGQFTTGASGGGSGVNPFQTVERKDVGLSLKVRPQISEGGTVKMAIYQEVSSVDTTASNSSGLITNKSVIQSNVLIEDGQIIALGGLMKDQTDDGEEGVPGLSKIPVVGNLFKYAKKSRGKTNLMIFIRPIVIRSPEQGNAVTLDRYDYMRTQVAPDTNGQGFSLKMEKGKLISPPADAGVNKATPPESKEVK